MTAVKQNNIDPGTGRFAAGSGTEGSDVGARADGGAAGLPK